MPANIILNTLLAILIFIAVIAVVFIIAIPYTSQTEKTTDIQTKITSKCLDWIKEKCDDNFYNTNLKNSCEKLYGSQNEEQVKNRCKIFCGCP